MEHDLPGISTILSLGLHLLLALFAVLYSQVKGCHLRKQKVEFVEFTIAVDAYEAPETPEVKSDPAPQPDDIPSPVPVKERPKPPKDPPKKPPKKIEKGKRVTRKTPVASPVKPKEKQTLTDEEIRKWLNRGAKIGETTSLPKNEMSLNASILQNALYAAWQRPPTSSAGSRSVAVEFDIASNGRLSNPKIVTSSGSPVMDQSVLDAVRNCLPVRGLSAEFIKAFPRLSVEFHIED